VGADIACNGSTCAAAAVGVAALPGNAQSIIDTLASAKPRSNETLYTPTECAIRGMTAFCKQHTADTGEKCVGVLISDGAPTRCDEDTDDLSDFAASAFRDDGVLTFTLGMSGADFDVLDSIAEAGGTDCSPGAPGFACDVTAGQEAFLAALNAIRETVSVTETRTETREETVFTTLDCEWEIPKAPVGQVFDRDRVNVVFIEDDAEERIGRVPSKTACGEVADGWHYDVAETPTKVLACPDTCDRIKSAADGAGIDVEFGCETFEAMPR
jgi:hypothetical protein